MKKIVLSATAMLMVSSSTFAGGLLTNTNQNIAFNRNFARNATLGIEGAYSNPAGLAWLGNGTHLSLGIQSAYQSRDIHSTFLPFAGNLNGLSSALGEKTFEGNAAAPILPSFQAAFQKDEWTVSVNFALTGGGGKCAFDGGLPSFEAPVSMIPFLLNQNGISAKGYGFDTYMYGRQYVYGLQAGVTRRLIDQKDGLRQGLAVYAGARMNYVTNKYKGYVRNISTTINGNVEVLNPYFTKQSEQLTAAAQQYTTLAEQATMAGNTELAAQYTAGAAKANAGAQTALAVANKTKDIELDCGQTGWGFTPIIGVDYRIANLNIGARMEFNTHLNIENDTQVNTTGVAAFNNGVNTPNDLPGLFTIGAQYSILPSWRVMAGYNYYFDKTAKMSADKQKALDHNTYEVTLGSEYDVTNEFMVSAGYMKTAYGVTDGYQSDLSFSCNSYSVGFGARIKLNKMVDVDVAYFWTTYDDYTKQSASQADGGTGYNGTPYPGKDVYSRTNKVFGAGVNVHF